MSTPAIYQYMRVSSKAQLKGTGLEQQSNTTVLEALSGKYQLPIATKVYEDLAVSSFKSKNFTDGDLGVLVKDCQSGVIPEGSIIVMFSLDRLSRDEVNKGQEILLQIINSGVLLHTVSDGQTFDAKDGTAMMSKLMLSVAFLARANEESLVKSKRTVGNALSLIKRIQAGERSAAGYPLAIESVGRTVWWCDSTHGDIRPDPYYFPIVKQICDWITEGYGSYKIIAFLNDTKTPPLSRKQLKINQQLPASEVIPSKWNITTIRKIHNNRALLGERTMNLQGETYKLDQYYPPILTEAEFYNLQAIRDKRVHKSTSKKWVGIASGIGITTCQHCGYGMSYVGGKTSPSYICLGAQSKRTGACTKMWSISAKHLEDAIIRLCIDKTWAKSETTSNKDELVAIETMISETKSKLTNLQSQVETLLLSGSDIPKSYNTMLITFESKLVELNESHNDQVKLTALKKQSENTQAAFNAVPVSILDKHSITERTQARELVRRSVGSITIKRIAKGHHQITITFVDGESRTVRRHLHKLFIPANDSFTFPVGDSEDDDRFDEHLFTWGDGTVDVSIELGFTYQD